jgi:hypothetical protein
VVPLGVAGFAFTVLLLVPGFILSISVMGTLLGLPLVTLAPPPI